MLRKGIGVVMVLALCAGGLQAAETKGKLKSVDPDKGIITITVDDKDQEFAVTDETKIVVQDIRSYEPKERLKDPVFKKKGLNVTIVSDKKDGKTVVKEIIIFTGRRG